MIIVSGEAELQDIIDFIICLGGDGTLLYASSLFEVNVATNLMFIIKSFENFTHYGCLFSLVLLLLLAFILDR